MKNKMFEDLRAILPEGAAKMEESFSQHTTFQIGGPADVMVWPETIEEMAKIVALCYRKKYPLFVLGNGSNLLVSDEGMEGVVLNTERMATIRFIDNGVYAECGVLLATLSAAVAERSLTGLEFACGIPGSVGGAIYMNAGAYGGEMKDIVEYVDLMNKEGEVIRLSNQEMNFSYRHSRLKDEFLICIGVKLELNIGNSSEINSTIAELTERREMRQPLNWPSAGSTFKRPPGKYAGPLIIESGMQGYRVGGAEVSRIHAGFIVNAGGATAADVLKLIEIVKKAVLEQSGVELEPEVRMVGRPMREDLRHDSA